MRHSPPLWRPGLRLVFQNIYHPDEYDPSVETEAMSRDIEEPNDEMVAAGVKKFCRGPFLGRQREIAADAAQW
jgi:hypothetical protein